MPTSATPWRAVVFAAAAQIVLAQTGALDEAREAKRKGDLRRAEALVSAFVASNPESAEAEALWAWVLVAADRRLDAIPHFERVIELVPDGTRADEARQALKRLRPPPGQERPADLGQAPPPAVLPTPSTEPRARSVWEHLFRAPRLGPTAPAYRPGQEVIDPLFSPAASLLVLAVSLLTLGLVRGPQTSAAASDEVRPGCCCCGCGALSMATVCLPLFWAYSISVAIFSFQILALVWTITNLGLAIEIARPGLLTAGESERRRFRVRGGGDSYTTYTYRY